MEGSRARTSRPRTGVYKIPEADVLVGNLLSIFSEEESKEDKLGVSASLHQEHLEAHVRTLATLAESIRQEFLKWHAALKSQAEALGAENPLVMAVAKHLLKVLGREKMEVTDDEGSLIEANGGSAQEGTMLPALYLTQVAKEAHVCRCLTCQPDVEEAMKEAIDQSQEGQRSRDRTRSRQFYGRKVCQTNMKQSPKLRQ